MRKVLIYSYVFIVCNYPMIAQNNYLNKLYSKPNSSDLATCQTVIKNNRFVLSANEDFSLHNSLCLYKVDSAANVLDSTVLNYPNLNPYLSFWKLEPYKDSIFYLSFGANTSTSFIGILLCFNDNGDTLWSKKYVESNDSSLALYGTQVVSNGLLHYGYDNSLDKDGDIIILKTDFNGNEKWRKIINQQDNHGISSFIKIHDNKFFLSGNKYINVPTTQVDEFYGIIDSLGNYSYYLAYGTPYADYTPYATLTNDNHILVSDGSIHYTLNSGTYNYGRLRISKLDTSANIIWTKEYGPVTYNSHIKQTKVIDNKIYSIGDQWANSTFSGVFFCTDLNGDSLYYHNLFYQNATDKQLTTFFKDTDGFFFIAGNAKRNGNNFETWVLKIDSIGCDSLNCYTVGINNSIEKENIKIYPNPCDNILNISYAINEAIKFVQISDLMGNILFTTNNSLGINTSPFAKGVYLAKITFENREVFNLKFCKQ